MNRDVFEIIKQKLPIESVVGSYIKLEKAGKNFRACCPFHNEKTPSFTVTPDKGIYYCFGCQKGGDIFQFVEEIEGFNKKEALKFLADKAGVSLDTFKSDEVSKKTILFDIMEQATRFYEIGLRTNKSVVDYLLGRGLEKETMISFRIGYAEQGWSRLYEFLIKKYSEADILATGLCIKSEKGKGCYDRFRERIMFPIMDTQGRVIAFTGRVMPGTEEAARPVGKYINSPETVLFHKSNTLFAFDKAKSFIHTEGFAIIVEGQMDCIMSHQAGVKNVVALSGTASTDLQMLQLKRFTQNVALCLDADTAGLAAAWKTAMVAYAHDMNVLVIDVEFGKDPADVIAENHEAWKSMVAKRKNIITFRLDKMKSRKELSDKIRIAEKELFPLLANITSQIAIDDALQEIAHAFGQTSSEPIRKDFENYLTKNKDNLKNKLTQDVSYHASSVQEVPLEQQVRIIEALFHEKIEMSDQNTIRLISEWERQMGSFAENKARYELFHKTLSLRRELELLEHQQRQLQELLVADPENIQILRDLNEVSRRKDLLIHQLKNH